MAYRPDTKLSFRGARAAAKKFAADAKEKPHRAIAGRKLEAQPKLESPRQEDPRG
jgi:hypothetical protein